MSTSTDKPLLRGHFHQAAFFIALGASAMLIAKTDSLREVIAVLIYSLSLTGQFGISALYHRRKWSEPKRILMKRLDHAAIFVLIAGTGTPICMLALSPDIGFKLLLTMWSASAIGILQCLYWTHAPKWVSAVLYIVVGWISVAYFSEIEAALGLARMIFLCTGGLVYSVGAVIYALKRPNPVPGIFGYHEVFHVLVIIGALLHFLVVYGVLKQ